MAKYSKGAGKGVESAIKRMEKGKLRSGRSGKKVTNPKQAIAIGLSEARKKGAKVPKKKNAAKKSAAKKTAVRKSAVKKRTAPKKRTAAKKAATASKTPARKKTAKKAAKKTTSRKHTSANTGTVKEKANLRSATAEMEAPVATNHVQTEMLQSEDPMRSVDQHAFDRFTTKGDPRQKLQLSSKPKSAIKPSGKKPLWN